jgi:hypothetical protein
LVPFSLGISAVVVTLVGWAVFAPSRVGIESPLPTTPNIAAVRSLAYIVPTATGDEVVARPADGSGHDRVIARFPAGALGYHARGIASPLGDQIAVLWQSAYATTVNLSIVSVSSGSVRNAPGEYDPLTHLAWASDESSLLLTRTQTGQDGRTSVIEIDPVTLAAKSIAELDGAFAVAPVGYSYPGGGALVVVVDQKGSNLFAVRGEKLQRMAELSPGRTADWSLSPDGSRLAFVDVLGGGSRTYVGRTLLLANGSITTLPAERNQIGASWMPGSPVPVFGGPGGAWQLTDPDTDSAYIVPEAWSPDGRYVLATTYSAGSDGTSRPSTALELITRETGTDPSVRILISDATGASFLGWVQDQP